MRHDQVNPATADPGENRIIRERECARLTGLSRCHRWRLERDGRFPKRLRLGEVAHGWLLSEVQGWLREKAEAREAA